jgi:aspartate-semialdehyde dehydrogenase
VDLYGATGGEVLLSEYAGEARMIQEPDVEELARHELIFLCEPGEASRLVVGAAPRSLIIDLGECLPAEMRALPVRPSSNQEIDRGAGRFAVPHPLTLVLAEILEPVDRRLGLVEAMAVVLRPAADFGQEGIEELREQTVRLLNFSPVPVEVFGRQLAFNLLPQAHVPAGQDRLARRIQDEVTTLLGQPPRLALRLLAAPLFHGHGLQLRLRLARSTSLEELRAVLDGAGLLNTVEDEAATPLDVTSEVRTVLSEISEDGLGAFWCWGVAGEAGARGAREAIRLAASLLDI